MLYVTMFFPAQLDAPRQKLNTEVSSASEVPQSRDKLIF